MRLYFYNEQSTNYFVTNDGCVINKNTQKQLKGQKNYKNGYWSVNLSLPNNTKKRLYIHRMVAETFLPHQEQANLEVNHIDGDKDNNQASNLEWVTSKDNKQHAWEMGLYQSAPVYCFDDTLELVAEYKNLATAVQITGKNRSQLSKACNMNPKAKSYGYYWSFSREPHFQILQISTGKEKPVRQMDCEGNVIGEYKSIAEASRQTGCHKGHIGAVCNGRGRTHQGYVWEFIDKDIV